MIKIDKGRCNGCHACYNACPKDCIKMVADSEGFVHPEINADECVDCRLCERACPVISETIANELKPEKAEALVAVNLDEKVRLKSSSGGIFTLLAEHVLDNGGVVFGAAFSHDFKSVEHISVESKDELYRLRGSKYLQSSIKDSYKRAKEFAEKGRMVLFSGTPCQIAGLYGYLGKDYENLYTQDIVCHGVPSPVVWSKYVDWREHEASSKTREISFRNKSKGWASYSLHFSFENGSEYSQTVTNDLYLRGFVSNVYLRPSCYNCSFKGKERPADITLADFWGVDRVVEGFNDKKGTSLIILGSPKGKKLLDLNRQKIRLKEADINRAIAFNSAAVKSSLCPKTRREFFAKLGEVPYSKLMEKYCGIKFREKVKRKIKQLIKK